MSKLCVWIMMKGKDLNLTLQPVFSAGLNICKTPSKRVCLGYNTKLHLMVRLHFQRSEKWGELFHCHYSQIHYDPDW